MPPVNPTPSPGGESRSPQSSDSQSSDPQSPDSQSSQPADHSSQLEQQALESSDRADTIPTEQPLSPLENLQRRYADQLSEDIETLETELAELTGQKSSLESELSTLQQLRNRLRAEVNLLEAQQAKLSLWRASEHSQQTGPKDRTDTSDSDPPSPEIADLSDARSFDSDSFEDSLDTDSAATDLAATDHTVAVGPLLPGETEVPIRNAASGGHERIELPVPATSELRRVSYQPQPITTAIVPVARTRVRRGFIFGAIAAALTAWQYSAVGAVMQGGQWLSVPIGALGIGFVQSSALLWLRMLVAIPVMVTIAPKIYRRTWDDLHNWFNAREQVLALIVGSGVALFLSQALIYQSIGNLGAVIGSALFFLYPLTALPLRVVVGQARGISPFALLALVAIAMGAFLVMSPLLSGEASSALGTGLLASLCFSLYIVLTNWSYRKQCHPIPVTIVQFSTMAVLSSLVLLLRPLKLVTISWLSLSLWGILIGCAMLLVYLLNYSSLRAIGPRAAIVAAATPLLTLIIAWSFKPVPSLEIIQWTGIFLISVGGIALSKEKLDMRRH